MTSLARLLAATVAGLALAGAASAQTSPADKTDGEWVMVTGDISGVTAHGFTIDYGEGRLPVEMDGFAADTASGLRAGDWVTVSGRIDDSFWERRSIEAASVYSSRLQERFWGSPRDDEGDWMALSLIDLPNQGDWVGVTGRVMSVDRMEQEMVLDIGANTLQVDVSSLGGPVLATRGDRVSVYGRLDDADLWDAREIDAASVVILQQG